jgi:hypothetical protein
LKVETISAKALLYILFLYLLCFLAKTTMLLYCIIVLAYKPLLDYINNKDRRTFSHVVKSLLIFVPAFIGIILVYLFFLSKGMKPTIVNQLKLSFQDLLVPLSSPVNSVLSIQQWILRAEKLFYSTEDAGENALLIVLYLLCFAAVIMAGIQLYNTDKVDSRYKLLLILLYAGLSAFFIFSYSFDTNIDYSSRHFKLLGFLFLPGFITVISWQIRSWLLIAALSLFCIFAILDLVYIKKKWTADRYISANYIYRNYDNLEKKDSLDETSYRKLIDMDRSFSSGLNKDAIFYIESNEVVEMDMRHLCITQKRGEYLFARTYQGKGPALVACISKKTFNQNPELLRKKFPAYLHFSAIDETREYLFFYALN